ncbi:stage II sporulation protein M [Methanobrevibacter sp.]|uniref:stage II sporulation protein M n=1 Tax=Methanobrevibacter sp. TaxID=66852 RepID=UPI003865ABAE
MLEEVKLAFSENKMAIYTSIAIMAISLVLGYFLEPYMHSYLNPVVEDLTQKVQTGVITLTFQSIFLNNIRIVFAMFIYGGIFCFSAVILGFNGFFVGYYVATTDDFVKALLLIMPHGIFEFSSCIIACASGFVLFNSLVKFLKTLLKQENNSIRDRLSISFDTGFGKLKQAFVLFVVASILMAIAGFIEAYLTLPIAEFIYPFLS